MANTTTSTSKNIPIKEKGAIKPCHKPEKNPHSQASAGKTTSILLAQLGKKTKSTAKIKNKYAYSHKQLCPFRTSVYAGYST